MEKDGAVRHTSLVVSPLKALMADQLNYLNQHNAVALTDETNPKDVREGMFSVIFTSPEEAVLPKWKSVLKNTKSEICVLVYDEAHCISSWPTILPKKLKVDTEMQKSEQSFMEVSYGYIDHSSDPDYNPDEEPFEVEDVSLNFSFGEIHPGVEMLEPVKEEDIVLDVDAEPELEEIEEDVVEEMPPDEPKNAVEDKKTISFESCLIELASLTLPSVCRVCHLNQTIKTATVGSAMYLKWVCPAGHIGHTWCNQPKLRNMHMGDFLLACSILTSGNNYAKIALMCKFLNLGCISESTFGRTQASFCVPVIEEFWSQTLQQVKEQFKDKDMIVAGDGRNDSPGFSAQYCTYTLMEYETKAIVAMSITDKRETGLKSTNLEIKGLEKCLTQLEDHNITEVITDAHPQITAMFKTQRKEIKHSYDVWHVAKNLGKKLNTVAAMKGNGDLKPWIQDIINHLWYCLKTAEGNLDVFIAKWRGVVHHLNNQHEWLFGDAAGIAACEHAPIDPEVERTKPWITSQKLLETVFETIMSTRQTGELESYHNHILMYASKRHAYSPPVYTARCMLAALDYQHHRGREQLKTKNGELRYKKKFSKRNSQWSAVPVLEKKKYDYIPELLKRMVEKRLQQKTSMQKKRKLSTEDPRRIAPSIAAVPAPSTSELVEAHKSRYK